MEITPEIVASFREKCEGFTNTTTWPDNKVTEALQEADGETGSSRWGGYADKSLKQRGLFAYAAHFLTSRKLEATASALGQSPGALGKVQAKTVADESETYAVNAQNVTHGNESLSTTSYGQEFLRLRRRAGMGAAHTNLRVS